MSAPGSRTVPAAVKAPPPGAESRNTSPRTLIASATRALPSSPVFRGELGARHAEPCDVRADQPDRARGGEGALVTAESRSTLPPTLSPSAARALPFLPAGQLGAAHAERPCDVRAGQPDRAGGGEGPPARG